MKTAHNPKVAGSNPAPAIPADKAKGSQKPANRPTETSRATARWPLSFSRRSGAGTDGVPKSAVGLVNCEFGPWYLGRSRPTSNGIADEVPRRMASDRRLLGSPRSHTSRRAIAAADPTMRVAVRASDSIFDSGDERKAFVSFESRWIPKLALATTAQACGSR